MKRLTIIILTLFFCTYLSAQESGQNPHQGESAQSRQHKLDKKHFYQKAELTIQKLDRNLDLSDQQYDQIKELSFDNADRARKIHEKYRRQDEKRAKKTQELMSDYISSIKEVLDDKEQIKRFEEGFEAEIKE